MACLSRSLFVFGWLLVMACASPPDASEPAEPAATPTKAEEEGAMLEVTDLMGEEWVAVTIEGEPLVDDTHVTILFGADGRVSGSGGCNRFSGSYSVVDGELSVGPLANTMMACAEPVMEQEQRLHRVLGATRMVQVEGESLVLREAEDDPETRFRRARMVSLRGSVVYRQRIALPPDAQVTVRLLDVSKMDASAVRIAETTFVTEGEQVPLPFVLEYDAGRIDPRMSYSLEATIRIEGKLAWRNDTVVPVITRDSPSDEVTIPVVQIPER